MILDPVVRKVFPPVQIGCNEKMDIWGNLGMALIEIVGYIYLFI